MICDSCHLRLATHLVTFDDYDTYACCWVCAGAARGYYGVVSDLPERPGGDAA